MSQTGSPDPIYPTHFDDVHLNVPHQPNVEFSFVVKAPKAYVMDAWHLTAEHGGPIQVRTPGRPRGLQVWPGVADGMERVITVSGVKVTQVVGNVRTPDEGDWHFEWKAGAPYYTMPFPFGLVMQAVHGAATLSDGPGEHETTVTIRNRHRPGLFLGFTRFAIRAATPGLSSAAPKRFAHQQFVGPEPIGSAPSGA